MDSRNALLMSRARFRATETELLPDGGKPALAGAAVISTVGVFATVISLGLFALAGGRR